MTTFAAGDLIEVRLHRLPVEVYAKAQEHADELMREFALIAQERDVAGAHEIPARLIALVDELNATYSTLTVEQENTLARAVADGTPEIDEVVFRVPAQVADACRHLGDILDEADRYCAEGQHLLTLATPPQAKLFRDWYLGEFIRQVEGEPPLPWPQFARESTVA